MLIEKSVVWPSHVRTNVVASLCISLMRVMYLVGTLCFSKAHHMTFLGTPCSYHNLVKCNKRSEPLLTYKLKLIHFSRAYVVL